MKSSLTRKLEKLRGIVSAFGEVYVAFSGGLDSTFVLKTCIDELSVEKVFPVTARSSIFSSRQLIRTSFLARKFGVNQIFIDTNELRIAGFVRNEKDRCHFCKKNMYGKIVEIAKRKDAVAVDGTNFDDRKEGRPTDEAVRMSGIVSPLALVGLGKEEIREIASKIGIENWDEKLDPCLASKIETGLAIRSGMLFALEEAQKFLAEEGIEYRDMVLGKKGFKIFPTSTIQKESLVEAGSFFKRMGYVFTVEEVKD